MRNSGDSIEPRDSSTIQSVDRAIDILELLTRTDAGITEIASELGVHKSTASRLVHTLKSRRLVEQHGERGRFTLGMGMLRFTGAVAGQLDIVQIGNPVCEELAERLGETVNVAVLDSLDAINVSQARGTSAVAAQNWIGQRTPSHATASGKVLLAFMARAELDELLAGELVSYTPRTITDLQELRENLKKVAEDGYAICFEELEPGLHAIGVPVFGPGDEPIAAISAAGPAYRLSRKRIPEVVEELQRGARDLAGRLALTG
ncbi:IclR family transcriptional regulator [Nocardiopsis valliformis]|uniref:IclR family transcriptional regulator n=1 Tax=Nocardiopsis valliformis TaxID=239974 RepID=UPI00034A3674|nr:IclR family transcriptional regulator [Nocardiopsis valliformis]